MISTFQALKDPKRKTPQKVPLDFLFDFPGENLKKKLVINQKEYSFQDKPQDIPKSIDRTILYFINFEEKSFVS